MLRQIVAAGAGDSIEIVARELAALAQRSGIRCECEFNDVLLVADPDGEAELLLSSFYLLQSKTGIGQPGPRIATSTHLPQLWPVPAKPRG